MSRRGNGTDKPEENQTVLELDERAPSDEQSPPDQQTAAGQETNGQSTTEQGTADKETSESAGLSANRVSELGSTQDGCWKVLADGERVEISDKEWRKELTRLLASPSSTS